jgi:hypothetical protein
MGCSSSHESSGPQEELAAPFQKLDASAWKPTFRTSHAVCKEFPAQQRLAPKIATAFSISDDTATAMETAAGMLRTEMDGVADLVLCVCNSGHYAQDVRAMEPTPQLSGAE